MARSPVSPGGSRSRTRHVSFEEERLRAKLLRLTAEEPEIVRDIASAKAKWCGGLKSAHEEVIERRRTCARQSESKASETTLHWGVLLAIVLTIAGVTCHNSCSKGANLQASTVPPSSVSRTRRKSKRNEKVPPRGLGGALAPFVPKIETRPMARIAPCGIGEADITKSLPLDRP